MHSTSLLIKPLTLAVATLMFSMSSLASVEVERAVIKPNSAIKEDPMLALHDQSVSLKTGFEAVHSERTGYLEKAQYQYSECERTGDKACMLEALTQLYDAESGVAIKLNKLLKRQGEFNRQLGAVYTDNKANVLKAFDGLVHDIDSLNEEDSTLKQLELAAHKNEGQLSLKQRLDINLLAQKQAMKQGEVASRLGDVVADVAQLRQMKYEVEHLSKYLLVEEYNAQVIDLNKARLAARVKIIASTGAPSPNIVVSGSATPIVIDQNMFSNASVDLNGIGLVDSVGTQNLPDIKVPLVEFNTSSSLDGQQLSTIISHIEQQLKSLEDG